MADAPKPAIRSPQSPCQAPEIADLAARIALEFRLTAANEQFDSGNTRLAWRAALRAVAVYINSDPYWQLSRLARSVEVLGQALEDLERGHKSPIFQASAGQGQPTTTVQANIALYASAFVEVQRRRSGDDLKRAADDVAKWFKRAGIDVPANRILEWRRRHKRRARYRNIVARLAAAPEEMAALITKFAEHHLIARRAR